MKLLAKYFFFIGLMWSSFSQGQTQMHFETLSPERTGIDFTNTITESATFNYLNFQYVYNGGGVAIGDINNDGLMDIYFTGNQVSDKLYLNKGELKFEDITEKAIGSLAAEGWHTGVTMADVNQDGFVDIYVSRSGLESDGAQRSNLLFINNNGKSFKEEGEKYGVDISRGTSQSAFFDMDNDGDLDLYVMNRRYPPVDSVVVELMTWPYSDVLLENKDGHFEDISAAAGIQNNAYGLGISISDLNDDGLMDIYIANDYIQPDFLYINQGDNTFKDEIKSRTGHVSQNGMGSDCADINNDGLVDLMILDMVSSDHIRSKKNMSGMNPEQFWHSVNYGNQYEYMVNTLQLNNGNGTFSEIAQMSGVAKTDWSWGPLFADFDNDGLKDIFITNGFKRDVRDNDYLAKIKTLSYELKDYQEILDLAPSVKIENYFFKNMGGLHFEKVNVDWKMDQAINSNGAAYADLDNDGDLDLVINNMEEVSSILENKLESDNHYIRIKGGPEMDGAKVTVSSGGQLFYQEMHTTRGYQSCVEPVLHFGLGAIDTVDEIRIVYKNGWVYSDKEIEIDGEMTIRTFGDLDLYPEPLSAATLFEKENVLDFVHNEYVIDDFSREILLPHKMSQLGPFLSKGDINADGLEDFYVSGSRLHSGAMFIQSKTGEFKSTPGPWEAEKEREELGSIMLDVDADGDLDLYVTGGSNEYIFFSNIPKEEEYNKNLQDQLYINDGTGKFTNETATRLPVMINSGQDVTAADYDKDGDLDVFVGGRQVPGFYPFKPRSYLLQNTDGVFKDVTESSPDLLNPGMITQAQFDDIDQDGDLDIICVGEWMPVTIFENNKGVYTNSDKYALGESAGWWMSIEKGDFNGDGVNDYVLGNIGENNKFHPTVEHPLEVFVNDFDNSGSYDIVLGKYQNETCYPVRGRECSSQQMPFITQMFPTYDDFANANLQKIYGKKLDSALHYSANEFASAILLSDGKGGFTIEHLPIYAQLGPVNTQLIDDFNGDGNLDILTAGNNFVAEIETVRYDAGRGTLLLGDGKGHFEALAPHESGFFINSDAKDMININGLIIVSSNSDSLRTYRNLPH